MDTKQKVFDLLEREVSRAEFLRYVGIAFLGMFGITSFLRNLHDNVPARSSKPATAHQRGYGGSAYGR